MLSAVVLFGCSALTIWALPLAMAVMRVVSAVASNTNSRARGVQREAAAHAGQRRYRRTSGDAFDEQISVPSRIASTFDVTDVEA